MILALPLSSLECGLYQKYKNKSVPISSFNRKRRATAGSAGNHSTSSELMSVLTALAG